MLAVGLAAHSAQVVRGRLRPELAREFRRHDEELLADQAPHRNEVKKLVAVSLQGRRDLDQLLTSEAMKES